MRVLVFPERGGNAREWRFQQRHRAWLSVASAGAAFLVAAFVYVLIAAYQDVAAVNHLRKELAVASHVQAQNRTLRKQVATDRLQNQKALTEVQAMANDMHHVAGVLGLTISGSGQGLDNLFTRLQSMQKQLPKVLTAAEARDQFLAHKPDMLPVSGPVVSGFGWRTNPFGGNGAEFHDGIDIAVPVGTPVHSPADGVVTYAGWYDGYGLYVQINNGYGIESFFGHNSKVLVHVGEVVKRGQVVSLSGDTGMSTGPHVHFGIHYRGLPTNPWTFIHSNPQGVN
ncbi:MAG: peptidoglycan DD-metalloendopeptidase family protein [Thermaerobacter sp.]|nr:peptidoglycan DD-metalloendopeptidase family protein [Thermaerobacter sp.]